MAVVMADDMADESLLWQGVKRLIGNDRLQLGRHWSFNLRNDPKRLSFVLSRYKFAAKMIGQRNVLELGCSEGIGTPILAESALRYVGVDSDDDAIATARHNFDSETCSFISADFLGQSFGEFDAVVSLDVCEHIMPEAEHTYFDSVVSSLGPEGIAVIGTPNETSDVYASPMSKAGHVNLFNHHRMRQTLEQLFHNVFMFGFNDEILHTGFEPMCHYVIAVACNPKGRR